MFIAGVAGLTCCFVGMMMGARSTAEADDREQLEDIQQQLVEAWTARDRSILDRLLAPEWMVTHADGRISTREEILREFDTAANRLLEGRVEEIKVRLFGGFAIGYRTHPRPRGVQRPEIRRRPPFHGCLCASQSAVAGGGVPSNQDRNGRRGRSGDSLDYMS
jgi:hypothetical protein